MSEGKFDVESVQSIFEIAVCTTDPEIIVDFLVAAILGDYAKKVAALGDDIESLVCLIARYIGLIDDLLERIPDGTMIVPNLIFVQSCMKADVAKLKR